MTRQQLAGKLLLTSIMAWIIEEHLVILEQLGGQIPHYYPSTADTMVVFVMALSGGVLAVLLGARPRWRGWVRKRAAEPVP